MKIPKGFNLSQALKDLAIDRPVYRVEEVQPGVFRLYLYGGGAADWPPAAPGPQPATSKKSGKASP
jgi:hypothetical protein